MNDSLQSYLKKLGNKSLIKLRRYVYKKDLFGICKSHTGFFEILEKMLDDELVSRINGANHE